MSKPITTVYFIKDSQVYFKLKSNDPQFNEKFEQFRLDTFDLALTNYRDFNRKRVGFDFAYRFLSMIYDDIMNS